MFLEEIITYLTSTEVKCRSHSREWKYVAKETAPGVNIASDMLYYLFLKIKINKH